MSSIASLFGEVLERAGLDDAGGDALTRDTARGEFDGEVADELLGRRLRHADERQLSSTRTDPRLEIPRNGPVGIGAPLRG